MPNLFLRALVGTLLLPLSAVVLVPQKAHAADYYAYSGAVGKKGPNDFVPLNLSDPSTIYVSLKWPKPKARLALYLKPAGGETVVTMAGKKRPKGFSRAVQPGLWWISVRAIKGGSTYALRVTTTPNTPPPPPVPEECNGVPVSPGMDIQATIDGEPEGTTFCFEAGTYELEDPIVPKSYDSLIGQPGTILDGGDSTVGAVYGSGGEAGNKRVTVRGFIVQNFASSLTDPSQSAAIKAGWNWTVEKNEVRHNRSEGIRANQGVTVRNNYVHHNGKYGIVGYAADGMVWEGNEIAYNNTGNHSFGDAGASKICKSENVVLRGNFVHHNNGHGLWADTDNVDFLYENNLVVHNVGIGIFHEVSYDAVIRNNTVRYNAEVARDKSLGHGSNIQISVSQNVEIYGNTVEADTNGIGLHDIDRGSGAYGTHRLENVSVHDNVVKMKGSAKTGLNGRPEAFSGQANNRFWRNTYYVTNSSASFWFWEVSQTWPGWKAEGQDLDGDLKPWAG